MKYCLADPFSVRRYLVNARFQRVYKYDGTLVSDVHSFSGTATASDHQFLGARKTLSDELLATSFNNVIR